MDDTVPDLTSGPSTVLPSGGGDPVFLTPRTPHTLSTVGSTEDKTRIPTHKALSLVGKGKIQMVLHG